MIADSIRIEPAPQISLFTRHFLTGARLPIPDGGPIDFGNVPLDIITGEARLTKTVIIHNDGIGPLSPFSVIPMLPNGFSIASPPPPGDPLPPGAEFEIEIDFLGDTPGTFVTDLESGDVNNQVPPFTNMLTIDVIDDLVPPSVEIVSPLDGGLLVEGSTVPIGVDVSDDVGIRRVELLVDGQSVATDVSFPFEFNLTLPFLDDPQTSQSGEVTFSATGVDLAGNSTTSDPITINLLPADPPVVIVYPPGDDTNPFGDPFFDIAADVLTDRQIAQVEYLVNGVVVDTVNQEPYIGHIPRLNSNVSSTITVVALDIFGTEHVSNALTLQPPGWRPGNIDGDTDFDANDSFLLQLVKLSGTDFQIDQSKGNSSLTAVEIRTIINQMGLVADVDGDQDFDANDAFLIHLVQLAGTDLQIDLSKGSSLLTAAQIRANVTALAGPAAAMSVATQSLPVVQSVMVDVPNAEKVGSVDTVQSIGLAPAVNISKRSLFANVGPKTQPLPISPEGRMLPISVSETVWEEYRKWIDAI
ncbi:MAG: hypothetical protein GY903_19265 [Fuerstiella sp.]|nr:hypothetical protein [Fuerstiella sp.]